MANGKRWVRVFEAGLGGRIVDPVGFRLRDGSPVWIVGGDNSPEGHGFVIEVGDRQDVIAFTGPRPGRGSPDPPYSDAYFNTGYSLADLRIDVVMYPYPWPRRIFWYDALDPTTSLPDGDQIKGTVEKNALDPAVVEFHLVSELPWQKVINVPDGETGSSWDIWTGEFYTGGIYYKRSHDFVGLWAHQIGNHQRLTFIKAKTLGLLSRTYSLDMDLIVSEGGAEPGSRVTFNWIDDV